MNKLTYIISAILLIQCQTKSDQDQPANESALITLTDVQFQHAGIAIDTVNWGTINQYVELKGRVEAPPQNLISVSMPMGGMLKSTHLLPGAPVKKGEVIATLADEQYASLQADFLAAKLKLEQLSLEFNRQQQLNLTKISSDKALENISVEYRIQEVIVSGLKARLSLILPSIEILHPSTISPVIRLTAPVSGVVTKVNVNVGKYIQQGDELFEILDESDLHLMMNVFEKDLTSIHQGQKFEASTVYEKSVRYTGQIIFINPMLRSDGSAEVHGHFDGKKPPMLGTYLNVSLLSESKTTPVIQSSALVTFEGKKFVFVQRSERSFEMIQVSEVTSNEEWIDLRSPELVNLPVVVNGSYALLMALKNRMED